MRGDTSTPVSSAAGAGAIATILVLLLALAAGIIVWSVAGVLVGAAAAALPARGRQ